MNQIKPFLLGMWEFRSSVTWHYANDTMATAYDHGREWAHRLTLRIFDGHS